MMKRPVLDCCRKARSGPRMDAPRCRWPRGALPDDVSTDEVSLTVVSRESDEPGVPVFAVQLLPDGVVLSEPAALSFDLPDSVDGGFMVIHQSGDTIEFLGGDIQHDGDGLSFTTSVAHFSAVLIMENSGAFSSSLALVPETVLEGEIQLAEVAITKEVRPFSVWARVSSDPLNTWRLFEFSAPKLQSVENSVVFWEGLTRHWDPGFFDFALTPSRLEATASSTCRIPNEETVIFYADLVASATRIGRGDPIERKELSIFTEVLAGENATPVADAGTDLSKAGPGDAVQLKLVEDAHARSVCIDSVATTTTTTSTTVPVGTSSTSTTTTTTTIDDDGSTGGSKTDGDGSDPIGDVMASSNLSSDHPNAQSVDLVEIRHEQTDATTHCFFGRVVGDAKGRATDKDVSFFQISARITGGTDLDGGWSVSTGYFDGEFEEGSVPLTHSLDSDNQPQKVRMSGATVTIDWISDSEFKITVSGAEPGLPIGNIVISTTNRAFADDARLNTVG